MDGRVNGSLNLSRALGDMEYKQSKHLPPAEQIVTAYPDVRQLQLGSNVEFMILACDGIWDVLSNQQVGQSTPAAAVTVQSCPHIHIWQSSRAHGFCGRIPACGDSSGGRTRRRSHAP